MSLSSAQPLVIIVIIIFGQIIIIIIITLSKYNSEGVKNENENVDE